MHWFCTLQNISTFERWRPQLKFYALIVDSSTTLLLSFIYFTCHLYTHIQSIYYYYLFHHHSSFLLLFSSMFIISEQNWNQPMKSTDQSTNQSVQRLSPKGSVDGDVAQKNSNEKQSPPDWIRAVTYVRTYSSNTPNNNTPSSLLPGVIYQLSGIRASRAVTAVSNIPAARQTVSESIDGIGKSIPVSQLTSNYRRRGTCTRAPEFRI